MKYILILLCVMFIGCNKNKDVTVQENIANHKNEWKLEYFSIVTINEQELYNCVYGRNIGWNTGVAFSILSNEKCKDRL